MGTTIGDIKGDTRSLDSSSYKSRLNSWIGVYLALRVRKCVEVASQSQGLNWVMSQAMHAKFTQCVPKYMSRTRFWQAWRGKRLPPPTNFASANSTLNP